MPSCSQMKLQLLHFHAVFKTWPIFQELKSIVSFRRRWSQRNFSENRNIQANQSKDLQYFSRLLTLASPSSFSGSQVLGSLRIFHDHGLRGWGWGDLYQICLRVLSKIEGFRLCEVHEVLST